MSDAPMTFAGPGVVVDAPTPVVEDLPTMFQSLLAEADKEIEQPIVAVDISVVRPGYALVFDTTIPEPILTKWQERCRRDPNKPELNQLLMGKIVIANKCVAIRKDGVPVLDGNREPVTFNTPEFQSRLGYLNDANGAVGKFIGQDGLVSSIAGAVLKRAGYDAQIAADPLVDS